MQEPELRRMLSALGVTVTQKTHSGWLHASCPFAPWLHRSGSDRNPSFGAKIDEGGISSYHCQGCKMHGRISGLARALGHWRHGDQGHYNEVAMGADDADRMGLSADWHPGDEEREQPQQPVVEEVYANMFEPTEASTAAQSYLAGRGIGLRTAASLGLRFDPRQGRIVFPVRGPSGHCFGYSGRAVDDGTEPKVRDYAGLKKRQHILGADRWRFGEARPLVVIEGLFGYAHLIEMNLEAVADVGALLGSEMTDWKRDLIVQRNANTYLLLDNDPAGDQCLFGRINPDGERDYHEGAVAMLEHQVPTYLPAWPAGKDDPDQLTKREVWDMLQLTPLWGSGAEQEGWV